MIPVILSGGSGTRLWPVSRASYPKQFCEFFDHSFLQNSVERVRPFGEPYILTVESMRAITQRTAHELKLSEMQLIFEPMAKNTAPAMALLCHILNLQGKGQEIVGVFPADHLISDKAVFMNAVKLAEECAKAGEVVTLGIQPNSPATGYGYIEVSDIVVKSQNQLRAISVKGFCEKPSLKVAEQFLASGKHYWNAGMFVFRVQEMIAHFARLQPELWRRISEIKPDLSNAKYQYANAESKSFDYAIMEKLDQQVCIPCDMGWSDVGSWDEIARISEESSNMRSDAAAVTFSEGAQANYVFSLRSKVVGLVGVDNLIVVETPDALLIAKKGQSQKVKELLDQVKKAGLPEATEHPFELRPWGGFEVLADEKKFKAKTIRVDGGSQLSYQSHAKREEHWIIVEGVAEVVLNDVVHKLKAGQYIFIPQGAKHRIRNPGSAPLVFVEVQTGSYFGEDDIVRYQDDYNRI